MIVHVRGLSQNSTDCAYDVLSIQPNFIKFIHNVKHTFIYQNPKFQVCTVHHVCPCCPAEPYPTYVELYFKLAFSLECQLVPHSRYLYLFNSMQKYLLYFHMNSNYPSIFFYKTLHFIRNFLSFYTKMFI